MKWRLIQLCATLIYSLSLKGFVEVLIYKGKRRDLRVPGPNCYSCPGAIGSCPLGAPQNSLAAMDRKLPFYILGTLLLLDVTLDRTIYGFLCPPGFLQKLFYKIPLPKIKKDRFTMALSRVKYAVLAVFVIVLPIVLKAATRTPIPAFCKYIYPTGALEGGIPLVLLGESLGSLAGAPFSQEVLVSAVILLSTYFLYRSFYRFLCPLDAAYPPFAPVALLGVKMDHGVCMDCKLRVHTCKMDVRHVGGMECIQYGECMRECGVDAIH